MADPRPNTATMSPSWLTVLIASSNLRSVWRIARMPAAIIVYSPT